MSLAIGIIYYNPYHESAHTSTDCFEFICVVRSHGCTFELHRETNQNLAQLTATISCKFVLCLYLKPSNRLHKKLGQVLSQLHLMSPLCTFAQLALGNSRRYNHCIGPPLKVQFMMGMFLISGCLHKTQLQNLPST